MKVKTIVKSQGTKKGSETDWRKRKSQSNSVSSNKHSRPDITENTSHSEQPDFDKLIAEEQSVYDTKLAILSEREHVVSEHAHIKACLMQGKALNEITALKARLMQWERL